MVIPWYPLLPIITIITILGIMVYNRSYTYHMPIGIIHGGVLKHPSCVPTHGPYLWVSWWGGTLNGVDGDP